MHVCPAPERVAHVIHLRVAMAERSGGPRFVLSDNLALRLQRLRRYKCFSAVAGTLAAPGEKEKDFVGW
jgi:hypothetical protein